MKLSVRDIQKPADIRNPTMRVRAERARCEFSIQAVAVFGDEEAGYLSFDLKSQVGIGVIYEIFVLPCFRRQGIGNALLEHGENHARMFDCDRIVLKPEPFDQTVPRDVLLGWYGRRGYASAGSGETGELEKGI